MPEEELEEAFERLGEAEVAARVDNESYDHYTRAFALRWLGQKALRRVLADQKTRDRREAIADDWRRARRLMIMAALAILVLVAAVVWQSRLRRVFMHGQARAEAVLSKVGSRQGLK